jgi:hypothetical protein
MSANTLPDLTPRELGTVLAALRLWQDRNLPVPVGRADVADRQEREAMREEIAREHGPALDCEEIDELHQRLNAPQSTDEANPWHMLEELGNAVMHLHDMGGSGGTDAEDRVRAALKEAAKHVDVPI